MLRSNTQQTKHNRHYKKVPIKMQIIKFVVKRYQILRKKCIKINFGWGSAPDSAGGVYSIPRFLAEFKGAYI